MFPNEQWKITHNWKSIVTDDESEDEAHRKVTISGVYEQLVTLECKEPDIHNIGLVALIIKQSGGLHLAPVNQSYRTSVYNMKFSCHEKIK